MGDLSVGEFAAICGVSEDTILRAIHDGALQAYRPRARSPWRIRREDGDGFRARQGAKADRKTRLRADRRAAAR